MTPERIAELRALCDAATPGPWRANLHHTYQQAGRLYGTINGDDIVPVAAVTLGVEGAPQDEGRAAARFIAAARGALPEALDEIDRLRALLAILG